MPQRGCRAGGKRINSQSVRESKHGRKKLAIPPEGQEKTMSVTDKTAMALEEPGEPGVRMSATPDHEHLHVGPKEQDQNAGKIHDRVPEGLDAQRRATNPSQKIEVVPAKSRQQPLRHPRERDSSATILERRARYAFPAIVQTVLKSITQLRDDNVDMSSLACRYICTSFIRRRDRRPVHARRKKHVVRWRRKQRLPLTGGARAIAEPQ